MMDLTRAERLMLTGLGGSALLASGLLIWQEQRRPLSLEAGSPPQSLGGPQDGAQWEAQLQAARQVDVNQATAEELQRLPGVGPALAKRIIEHRQAHGPFRHPEELQEVPGIGPKTYEALKRYVKEP